MQVAIVGYGYVGKGMKRIFPDAMVYDPTLFPADEQLMVNTRKRINENCSLAIVCVPTPPQGITEQAIPDEQSEFLPADTSIVEEVISWLETPLILIKSTIPPGTTERLKQKYGKRICFSPEYMGEGGYYIPSNYPDPENPMQHSFMIIGGEQKDCDEILDIFIKRMGPAKQYYSCSSTEAELIKYMENTWIATKVTFANTWYDICQSFGVSYHNVRHGWALDPRVDPMHTAVFPDKRGFGGKCLPKDLHGIVSAVKSKGYIPKLLQEVWYANQKIRLSEGDVLGDGDDYKGIDVYDTYRTCPHCKNKTLSSSQSKKTVVCWNCGRPI